MKMCNPCKEWFKRDREATNETNEDIPMCDDCFNDYLAAQDTVDYQE